MRSPPPSSGTQPSSFAKAQDELIDNTPQSPDDGGYSNGGSDGPSRQSTMDSDIAKPIPPPKPDDPYAMLESVFGGGYVADQPKPVGGRPGEFDDLLL